MLHIIILAGGKAVRMGGDRPKPLVDIAGKPIIERLLQGVAPACAKPTIIVGYRGDEIIAWLGPRYDYVLQKEQLGTAHAVMCAKDLLAPQNDITSILVLFADHPLVTAKTAMALAEAREKNDAAMAVATVHIPHFEGDFALFKEWGRIVTDERGGLVKMVETRDATEEEKKITDVSPSFFCFDPPWLWKTLPLVKNENAKKEYGLTDMVNIAIAQQKKIITIPVDYREAMGSNTPEEVAIISKYFEGGSGS